MATPDNATLEVDVVLYEEEGLWIAQGLQFDVTARGDSPTQASDRFDAKVGAEMIMSIELQDEVPLAGVGQAPEKFWTMFKAAKMNVEKEQTIIRITEGNGTAKVRARMKISGKEAA
jgi:hypothetical protein